jgi:predicted dehydrogenase
MYRVAIIGHSGAGDYGHQLDQAFTGLDEARVVAVADPDDAGRDACLARTGAERGYRDYTQLLDRERPDITVVAPRWPGEHLAMAQAALAVGSHVYCEKPITLTLAQADDLIASGRDAGRLVGHALPWVHEPRTGYLLDPDRRAELVGEPIEVRADCKWDRRSGGEDFLILGIHFADMIRRLLGDAEACSALVTTAGRPATLEEVREGRRDRVGPVLGDGVHAAYRSGTGARSEIRSLPAAIEERSAQPYRLLVRGKRGMLLLRAPYADHSVWHYPRPAWDPRHPAWTPLPAQPKPTYADYHRRAASDLLAALEEGRQPLCTAEDGRAALEMIHAAYASHLANGAWVELPLKGRQHPLPQPR